MIALAAALPQAGRHPPGDRHLLRQPRGLPCRLGLLGRCTRGGVPLRRPPLPELGRDLPAAGHLLLQPGPGRTRRCCSLPWRCPGASAPRAGLPAAAAAAPRSRGPVPPAAPAVLMLPAAAGRPSCAGCGVPLSAAQFAIRSGTIRSPARTSRHRPNPPQRSPKCRPSGRPSCHAQAASASSAGSAIALLPSRPRRRVRAARSANSSRA